MREAEPRLSHHRRRHRADDQQPQTLRNADHAKATRYQCDHHRVVSQGDHLLEYQKQNAPQRTGGERYDAHERDQVSKPGGPHGQSSSSYWWATMREATRSYHHLALTVALLLLLGAIAGSVMTALLFG
jgi:hypothetical protein